jgi:hypothetical protein
LFWDVFYFGVPCLRYTETTLALNFENMWPECVRLAEIREAGWKNYAYVWQVYARLAEAGQLTGDRVWRMPLWKHYTDKIKKSALADLNNISSSPGKVPWF